MGTAIKMLENSAIVRNPQLSAISHPNQLEFDFSNVILLLNKHHV